MNYKKKKKISVSTRLRLKKPKKKRNRSVFLLDSSIFNVNFGNASIPFLCPFPLCFPKENKSPYEEMYQIYKINQSQITC